MDNVYQILKSFNVCYDPKEIGIMENCSGTPLQLIKRYRDKVKEPQDILWAACRQELGDDETLRLFTCWATKKLFKLIDNVQPESLKAVEITEHFIYNLATREQLTKARDEAEKAAYNTNTPLEFIVNFAASRCAGRVVWVTCHDVLAASWAATLHTEPKMDKTKLINEQIDKLIQLLERKEKRNG